MAEIIVIETSMDEDLSQFSRYLWQQQISHRIVQHDYKQLLLVGTQEDAARTMEAYRSIRAGDAPPTIQRSNNTPTLLPGWQLLLTPITTLFVLLSIAGYLLVELDGEYQIVKLLTFVEFDVVGNKIFLSLKQGQYWRLITPIFLHFGLLHVVFNALWMWDLGRRIEHLKGGFKLFGLILIIGMGSNITQFLYAKSSIFGGMSGVIYGLLGYGWVWSRLRPEQSLHIPNPVVYFMLGWMVLCMLGFSELLGAGAVANAAHLGGLIIGVILGMGAAFIARTRQ